MQKGITTEALQSIKSCPEFFLPMLLLISPKRCVFPIDVNVKDSQKFKIIQSCYLYLPAFLLTPLNFMPVKLENPAWYDTQSISKIIIAHVVYTPLYAEWYTMMVCPVTIKAGKYI